MAEQTKCTSRPILMLVHVQAQAPSGLVPRAMEVAGVGAFLQSD